MPDLPCHHLLAVAAAQDLTEATLDLPAARNVLTEKALGYFVEME